MSLPSIPEHVVSRQVGQRVLVRTAFNELRKATLVPVPLHWRDQGGEVQTHRGLFPKHWVKIEGRSDTTPWPCEDVFTDLASAEQSVAAHADEGERRRVIAERQASR